MENRLDSQVSTAEQFLTLLKTSGLHTAAGLSKELRITNEAARLQLLKLAQEGLVQARAESRGVGRPTQVWYLTEAGHARFPDAHAGLTVQLIESIRVVLGEAALDQLIASREQQTLASYTLELAPAGTLEERLTALTAIRTREGYMAEWTRDEQGYLLLEHHCPICAAATACQGFCRAELSVFQQVLGPEVSITRISHILAGAGRCAYRIINLT